MNATTTTTTTTTTTKVLPNSQCPDHGAPWAIATDDKGKSFYRQCNKGDKAHGEATHKVLPVTTAARFLAGLPWADYLKANKGDGSNATARKNALAALAK